MDVKIKDLSVSMEVKSNGIEFEVRQPKGGSFLGDCFLTMSGLVWCAGKTTKAKGVKISWADFMTIMASDESKKAAVKAANKV